MTTDHPTPTPVPMPWRRYVALGDSFTEGMCDDDPAAMASPDEPDRYAGWADRLARHLGDLAAAQGDPFEYANLAVRGRLLDDVVGPQLEQALELSPDLVSLVGGGNDLLRPAVDVDSLGARVEAAVVRLRAAGIDVLLATPTDPRDSGIFRPLRLRHAVHAANISTIAARHGCHVLDLWGLKSIQDWQMWAADRIHLSTPGHLRVADAARVALGLPPADAAYRRKLPPLPPAARAEELRAHAEWLREYAGPWVERRVRGTSSGDAFGPKRPVPLPLPATDPASDPASDPTSAPASAPVPLSVPPDPAAAP